jgi:hypothetical protein
MPAQTLTFGAVSVSPSRKPDGRVAPRHKCGLPTSCEPTAVRGDRELKWPATIRDISVSGIGLLLKRRFERGAGLTIELPENGSNTGYTVLAKVIHATAQNGGYWLLGCAFVSELSDEELEGLLESASLQPSLPGEEDPDQSLHAARKNTPARPTGSGRLSIANVHFQAATHDGRVIRRFIKSLLLRGSWPLAAGATIKVRVGDAAVDVPAVKMQVVACAQRDGSWTLEGRFAEAPSAAVLRSFG